MLSVDKILEAAKLKLTNARIHISEYVCLQCNQLRHNAQYSILVCINKRFEYNDDWEIDHSRYISMYTI